MLSKNGFFVFLSLLLFNVPPAFAVLVPLTDAKAVVQGENHACALLNTGGVKCWGWNIAGQLGNGTTIGSSLPVAVTGLNSGVKAVASGSHHTCALLNTGEVQCWGDNSYGQLGNGTITAYFGLGVNTPVTVTGLSSGVTAISANLSHTCVLLTTGEVRCWGGEPNDYGIWTNNSKPVTIAGLSSGIIAIAVGGDHSCVLLNTGGVQCWGNSLYGQLGSTSGNSPVTPTGLSSGVTTIAAGNGHTCVLLNTGEVQCWGYNHSGQLGNSTQGYSYIPTNVTGLSSRVTAISLGNNHTCAVTTSGVQCWGLNSSGQLGNGTMTNSIIPVAVTGLSSGVTAITAGYYDSCVLLSTSEVQCWGANSNGQLGNGTATDSSTPIFVMVEGTTSPIPTTYSQKISVSDDHSCAIIGANNSVICWGSNTNGQSTPPSGSFSQISAGNLTSCGIRTDNNSIACWGKMDGIVPSVGSFSQVVVGSDHACGLLTDGSTVCWVTNNTYLSTSLLSWLDAVITPPNDRFSQITAGKWFTCGIRRSDNSVVCWGINPVNGTDRLTSPSGSFTQIDANSSQTCGVKTDGSGVCWGGDLGPLWGGMENRTPSDKFRQVSAGGIYGCGIRTDSTITCWGLNTNGIATPISGNFLEINASLSDYCAIRVDGTIACNFSSPPDINQQPIAKFTVTPEQGTVPLVVTLDAATSSDPEGKALTYEWTSQPALTIDAEKAPSLTISQAGTYTITLIVKDDKGLASAPVSKTVTVALPPTYPVTLNAVGSGSVTGAGDYMAGVTVNLTATPNANSTFTGWSPAPCAASFVMPNNALTCTATFTTAVVPPPNTSNCDGQHAIFDLATGIVTVPAVDIPMYDPITGTATGIIAVFKGQLKLVAGIEDFEIVPNSFSYLNTIDKHNDCHAEYTFADGIFSKGGWLHLPFVDVPTVIFIPLNSQTHGITQVFDVTLRQLAIDADVFHVDSYVKVK